MNIFHLSMMWTVASGVLLSGLQWLSDTLWSVMMRSRTNILLGIVYWLALFLLISCLGGLTVFLAVLAYRFFDGSRLLRVFDNLL